MKSPRGMTRRQFCGASAALALAATGTSPSRPQLRIATFRGDVTPPLGFPSHPSYKPLETIEHPLLAKGLVVDYNGRRHVLCAMDWCGLSNASRLQFQRKLADAVETDLSSVALHMVHQHTAPQACGDAQRLLDDVEDAPLCLDVHVLEKLSDRLAMVAKESLENLETVEQIGIGEAKVERVASSRRIITEDGEFRSRMSSTRGRPHLRELPEGLIDPMLKTVTFAAGDKPLARLHYYATHPQSFYGDPRVSYDFPGMAREELEREEGVFQVYFTGCAGDIAAGKYNDGSREARKQLASRLLAGMKAGIAAARYTSVGPVQWRTTPVALPANPALDARQLRRKMEDPERRPNGRWRAARRLASINRSDQPIVLSSLRVGELFLVHLPGEPMIEFQLYAQQQRADHFVAVAGYGEGRPYYICTEEAFEQGGYEPRSAAVGPESERLLKAGIRRLLGVT